MITIKYEIYRNDYDRDVNLVKTFSSLEDLGVWLLDYATPYSPKDRHTYLSVWSENLYKRIGRGNYKISSRNYYADGEIWVYLVQNEDGIIYSNGEYTGGMEHVSKDMMSFLCNLQNKYEHPMYKFVD